MTVGAIMRPEWREPFEKSMSDLGVTTVWLGDRLGSAITESPGGIDGLVIELSAEVMGVVTKSDFRPVLPCAGVPVASDSESRAWSLGISTILWGEEEARGWLAGLRSPHHSTSAPVIAVWGSAGAPGATSMAVGLAGAIAGSRRAVLMDADCLAPSVSELLSVPSDGSGLLGALRVARNEDPPVESVLACGGSARVGKSTFQVLTGMRPGSLGRLEAGAMSTLVDVLLESDIAIVADLKCGVGGSEPSIEKQAIDGVLNRADRVTLVTWASDVGVARGVRDWNLPHDAVKSGSVSIALRSADRSPGRAFREAARAMWELTGCTDIHHLPHSDNPFLSQGIADVVSRFPGLKAAGSARVADEVSGIKPSLRTLLPGPWRKPLP